jgi:hypothetical protein
VDLYRSTMTKSDVGNLYGSTDLQSTTHCQAELVLVWMLVVEFCQRQPKPSSWRSNESATDRILRSFAERQNAPSSTLVMLGSSRTEIKMAARFLDLRMRCRRRRRRRFGEDPMRRQQPPVR